MKVYRDSLLKMCCNNPGGDCYWVGGRPNLSCYRLWGFPSALHTYIGEYLLPEHVGDRMQSLSFLENTMLGGYSMVEWLKDMHFKEMN